MICCVHRTLAVALTALLLAVQSHAGQKSEAHVLIDLPSFVPSETVSINYILYGPFGAHGGFVTQEPGLRSYDIKSSVDGKAASEIKLLVYARGCVIRTFEIHFNRTGTIKREFDCRPLPTTTLSGHIVPRQLVVGKATQLRITYMATWSHEFFGIIDGPIVEIPLATATPDDTGMFQTDVLTSMSIRRLLHGKQSLRFIYCYAMRRLGTLLRLDWSQTLKNTEGTSAV
jgi:hypothetical protein